MLVTAYVHRHVSPHDAPEQHGNDLAGRQVYPALRKYGHAKNGRTDAPQLVVGLAVTRDGLHVRSWVFPGNTTDVTTIERVKADLRGWRLNRCVFVGDAGMNAEENRRTLALGGGKHILAARIRAGDTWRNILAELDTAKVVEYERAGARIQQTTELRPAAASLLKTLQIPPPPRLHQVQTAADAS